MLMTIRVDSYWRTGQKKNPLNWSFILKIEITFSIRITEGSKFGTHKDYIYLAMDVFQKFHPYHSSGKKRSYSACES